MYEVMRLKALLATLLASTRFQFSWIILMKVLGFQVSGYCRIIVAVSKFWGRDAFVLFESR